MSKYTVKSVMPTGKEDAKFGTEFYIQFNETEKAFPLWFKTAPEVGKEIEGDIVDGRFKKAKKEWKPNAENSNSPAGGSPSRAPYKDNSDGMRQGMCFNNAANYVNSLEFRDPTGAVRALSDVEWADMVFSYAQALYILGDLNKMPAASQETGVAGVFGA